MRRVLSCGVLAAAALSGCAPVVRARMLDAPRAAHVGAIATHVGDAVLPPGFRPLAFVIVTGDDLASDAELLEAMEGEARRVGCTHLFACAPYRYDARRSTGLCGVVDPGARER